MKLNLVSKPKMDWVFASINREVDRLPTEGRLPLINPPPMYPPIFILDWAFRVDEGIIIKKNSARIGMIFLIKFLI